MKYKSVTIVTPKMKTIEIYVLLKCVFRNLYTFSVTSVTNIIYIYISISYSVTLSVTLCYNRHSLLRFMHTINNYNLDYE